MVLAAAVEKPQILQVEAAIPHQQAQAKAIMGVLLVPALFWLVAAVAGLVQQEGLEVAIQVVAEATEPHLP